MGSYPFRPDFRSRQDIDGSNGIAGGSEHMGEELVPAEVERVNTTLQSLDNFISNSVEVLNYMADTMEKGDEFNDALERVITAFVKLILGNPIIKAVIKVAKDFIVKKAVEALNTPSDTENSFKDLINDIMDSPAIKDFIIEMVGQEMKAGGFLSEAPENAD